MLYNSQFHTFTSAEWPTIFRVAKQRHSNKWRWWYSLTTRSEWLEAKTSRSCEWNRTRGNEKFAGCNHHGYVGGSLNLTILLNPQTYFVNLYFVDIMYLASYCAYLFCELFNLIESFWDIYGSSSTAWSICACLWFIDWKLWSSQVIVVKLSRCSSDVYNILGERDVMNLFLEYSFG